MDEGQEIGRGSSTSEFLRHRLKDIRQAIAAGAGATIEVTVIFEQTLGRR